MDDQGLNSVKQDVEKLKIEVEIIKYDHLQNKEMMKRFDILLTTINHSLNELTTKINTTVTVTGYCVTIIVAVVGAIYTIGWLAVPVKAPTTIVEGAK